MLSKSQVELFDQQGFVAVKQVIDPETLEQLRNGVDEIVEESRHVAKSNEIFEVEPDHSPQRPRLRRISHPVIKRPIFWQTAKSEAVLKCLAQLIGPDIRFHHSKVNMKVADGGTDIGWHQDGAFFPHTNFDLVGCGIALDDCTTANGCLLVIPGTHRLPVLNHRIDDEFVGRITSDEDQFDPNQATPVELEAGDMSIHHALVVHGSKQNLSSDPRRLLIFEYAAADALPLEPRPRTNKYDDRIVYGKPPTHARLAGQMRIPLRRATPADFSLFERQAAKVSAGPGSISWSGGLGPKNQD